MKENSVIKLTKVIPK